MSYKKPLPLIPSNQTPLCPVCGERSYSSAGIHPQCSAERADKARRQHLSTKRQEEKGLKVKSSTTPWQRVCPHCRSLVHVRKKECGCGYQFTPSASQNDGGDQP